MQKFELHNRFDRIVPGIIYSFILLLFLLWGIGNILLLPHNLIWFAAVPISIFFGFQMVQINIHTDNEKMHDDQRSPLAIVLLVLCLLFSTYIYLEPILTHPEATIGIPNKDFHDGLTAYIARYGHPPLTDLDALSSRFIPNSHDGLYFGYPNVLHTLGALFIKLGVHPFHANWFTLTSALIVCSLSIYLFLKKMRYPPEVAAVAGGLFAVSSFRIVYGGIVSIPMQFSYALVLPAFLTILHTTARLQKTAYLIMPAIGISVVVAAYSGTWAMLAGLTLVYATVLLKRKKTPDLMRLIKLLCVSLPLVVLVLFLQFPIYWQNTFPTVKDIDPYELSQRIRPFDQPIYMSAFLIGFALISLEWLKKRIGGEKSTATIELTVFFIASVLALAPVGYWIIFNMIIPNQTGEWLAQLSPNGLWGGLRHQQIHRLALFQPYLFIFFIPAALLVMRRKMMIVAALVILILSFFTLKMDTLLFSVVNNELHSSWYNARTAPLSLNTLSNMRLVVNDKIWTPEIVAALDYINNLNADNVRITLYDERGWTAETVAGWGSVYTKQRIQLLQSWSELGRVSSHYLLYIGENDGAKAPLATSPVFQKGSVSLYQLAPID